MDPLRVEADAVSSTSTASHYFFLSLTRAIRWGPVAAIVAVVAWSYYVLVVVLEAPADGGGYGWGQLAFLLLVHACLLLLAWSFCATIATAPGAVPESWRLSPAMVASLEAAVTEDEWKRYLEMFALQMGVTTAQRSVQGAIRYCEKCCKIKPDRCHHCSVCSTCVLKMDHHCPWVNNCIGFANYKFFMLFLLYSYTYCIIVARGVIVYLFFSHPARRPSARPGYHGREMDSAGDDSTLSVALLGLVVLVLFVFLSSLFWYHLFLIVCNRSTLEQFRAPVLSGGREDKYAWNLGRLRNVQQVFGRNPVRAALPVASAAGDGLHFPRSRKSLARHELATVATSNGGSVATDGGLNGGSKDHHISVSIDSKLGVSDVYV